MLVLAVLHGVSSLSDGPFQGPGILQQHENSIHPIQLAQRRFDGTTTPLKYSATQTMQNGRTSSYFAGSRQPCFDPPWCFETIFDTQTVDVDHGPHRNHNRELPEVKATGT